MFLPRRGDRAAKLREEGLHIRRSRIRGGGTRSIRVGASTAPATGQRLEAGNYAGQFPAVDSLFSSSATLQRGRM